MNDEKKDNATLDEILDVMTKSFDDLIVNLKALGILVAVHCLLFGGKEDENKSTKGDN